LSPPSEITISPATRIEGHGNVTIVLDDSGNVSDAYFQATEIRGFEYFLRGMDAEKLPFMVSRICGVCSAAHMLASVKAIENICGTRITETAEKLRELLLLAQLIASHSLVFYFLVLPDFWFPLDENPSKRNIFQIMREKPDIGKEALKLRSFATDMLYKIGGREVHVVSLIAGGLAKPLSVKDREILLNQARGACSITQKALELGKTVFEENWDRLSQLSNCCRTSYMALNDKNNLEFYHGKIRIIDSIGNQLDEFEEQDYVNRILEESSSRSYSKSAYYKASNEADRVVQVGPTARMNVSSGIKTEGANKELRYFKAKFGKPAHEAILFDYARLIDLMYACERSVELLEDESITRNDVRVPVKARAGEGVGIVEAPRGTLSHHYWLTRTGKLKQMKLIIPTQVNSDAIDMSIKSVASQFISNGQTKEGLLNGVEMLVRAFDPCIKCSTRMANSSLSVEIRDSNKNLLKILK
jgi:F420-non-reducing hydrogenase large subunit